MDEHVTTKEFERLTVVERYVTPAGVPALLTSKANVQAAVLIRSELAGKLTRRLRDVAKTSLLLTMKDHSAKITKEPWAEGIEFALWRAVATKTAKHLTALDIEKLFALAEESGGWFSVTASTDEPQFVPLDDWLPRYADWSTLPPEGVA